MDSTLVLNVPSDHTSKWFEVYVFDCKDHFHKTFFLANIAEDTTIPPILIICGVFASNVKENLLFTVNSYWLLQMCLQRFHRRLIGGSFTVYAAYLIASADTLKKLHNRAATKQKLSIINT